MMRSLLLLALLPLVAGAAETPDTAALLRQHARSFAYTDSALSGPGATGATRYLEELAALAPDETARRRVEELLPAARAADPGPGYSANWLLAADTSTALATLEDFFQGRRGAREHLLPDGLRRSAERLFRDKLPAGDQWMLRDLMNGYQAVVLLPGSRPGERKLGGR